MAIKNCTIFSLFSRTASGRKMEPECKEEQRCQSQMNFTTTFHNHIPQARSTNTFHTFHNHIPQPHSPKTATKTTTNCTSRNRYSPLFLFFFLLCMVLFKIKLAVGALLIDAGDCPAGCHLRCLLLFVGDRTIEPKVLTVVPSTPLLPLSSSCCNSGCSCCSCICCNCSAVVAVVVPFVLPRPSTPIVMLSTSEVKVPLLRSTILLGLVSGNTDGILSVLVALSTTLLTPRSSNNLFVWACRLCFNLEGRAFCLVLTTTGEVFVAKNSSRYCNSICGDDGGCCGGGCRLGEPLARRGDFSLGGVG